MKISFIFIVIGTAFFGPGQLADAQCPQICDTTNTALGDFALAANTTGFNNTAIGSYALDANTTVIIQPLALRRLLRRLVEATQR